MPGPNDQHFHNGVLLPGLGDDDPRKDTETVLSGPRMDGRTAEAKRIKAIEKAEAQLAKERADFEAEKAALRAKEA